MRKAAPPGATTFEKRHPRAFAWLSRVYAFGIALLLLEIGARIATFLLFRAGLSEFPEIQRRYEQSHAFYPAMTVGVVTGGPEVFPAAIPVGDGPPRIVPFGEIGDDAFRMPLPREAPQKGVVRVAFVGGSTTYDGYPESVGARLAERFGKERVEVVNLGLPASSTATTLILMRRFLPRLRPQIVVVYHGFNDLVYYHAREAALARRESGAAGPQDPAVRVKPPSRGIVSLARAAIDGPVPPLSASSLDAIAATYEAMAKLGAELGFSLWVSTFAAPNYGELDAKERRYFEAELRHLWPVVGEVERYALDLSRYHDRLREVAKKENLRVIDVAAGVRGGRATFRDNCHLTEAGREKQADVVAEALGPAIEEFFGKGKTP